MKATGSQSINVLLMVLFLLASVSRAQTINTLSDEVTTKAASFDVGTYMGSNLTMNLMLAIHQPEGVTILIRDTDNTILHRQHLKKSPVVYHHKLNFDGCKPGVYRVEISDGQQTIVRRVEVVNIPAIESQRYVTYSTQTSL